MSESIELRAAALAAFYASSRLGTPLDGSSAAGLLLHLCGSTLAAGQACLRMPNDPVWSLAARHLAMIGEAELADTLPPQSQAVAR